jgi:protein TonB
MFDLITGRAQHIPSTPTLPILASVAAQAIVVSGVLAASALWMAGTLPEIPTMMAFVAAPPPPPPPPPPAPAIRKARPVAERATPTTGLAAPIEVPTRIEPEPASEGFDEGVPGGVEGGIPGGVLGGIVGGLPDAPPPPPPPPPAPTPRGPVRVGGNISTPALVHRVEPAYPAIAVSARVQGVTILEAVVDEEGRVVDVRVLRSAGKLVGQMLDREAVAAVRQWRYAPLMLNGIPSRFVLTVTLAFQIQDRSS